jgi:hypothetical protein
MGFRMITNPDDLSCATRRSATILDMVSAACDRAIALPLVAASAAVSTSPGSAGVTSSSGCSYIEQRRNIGKRQIIYGRASTGGFD